MQVKYPLTAVDITSDKETIHAEFNLADSELVYTSGDALGIYPLNNPPEVDAMISALHCQGNQKVPVPPFCYAPKPIEGTMALRELLLRYYDLKTVKLDLMKLLARRVSSESEKEKGEMLLKDGVCSKNPLSIFCIFIHHYHFSGINPDTTLR